MTMAEMKSNKIVPIVLVVIGFFVVIGIFNRLTSKPEQLPVNTNSVVPADRDNQSESLQGLSGQIVEMQEAFKTAKSELDKSRDDLETEKKSIVDSVMNRITGALEDSNKKHQSEIEKLKQELAQQSNLPELPVGSTSQNLADGYVWSTVQTSTTVTEEGVLTLPDRLSRLVGTSRGVNGVPGIRPAIGGDEEKPQPIPIYTIPVNATLIHARGMTALIGRVPLNQTVNAPVPFKVITSNQALASNGFEIPEVERAVWSGYAFGDGTLKCVRGVIQSVTFIFNDGRIKTIGDSTSISQSRDLSTKGIGWISNSSGVQCLPGTYVSNAPEVMKKLIAAGTVTGFANGISQQQLTTQQTNAGVSSALTGDATEYALGRGLANGFSQWAQYVRERAADMFDAVVVPPGADLTINVTQSINIDYELDGRKLRYSSAGQQYDLGVD